MGAGRQPSWGRTPETQTNGSVSLAERRSWWVPDKYQVTAGDTRYFRGFRDALERHKLPVGQMKASIVDSTLQTKSNKGSAGTGAGDL